MASVLRVVSVVLLAIALAVSLGAPLTSAQSPRDYPLPAQGGAPKAKTEIKLIEPLTGQPNSIPANGNALFKYFETALGYFQSIAVGITILWLLVGGIMVMASGNNNSLREQGIQHAKWAVGGLLMLFMLGFILELLNSSFFKQ